jgi:hypothetical protein
VNVVGDPVDRLGDFDMKRASLMLSSAAAICILIGVAPASARGGDHRENKEQALTHPREANQLPYGVSYSDPMGDAYDQPVYNFGAARAEVGPGCRLVQEWNGQTVNVCAP